MDYIKRNDRFNELAAQMAKEIPDAMGAFTKLHKAATQGNALSKKVKELIALAIGITVRCDGCIASHVNDALRAGANRQEIMETIAVAILMGGGPSVVYGSEAMEALNQ
ncbi:MAG: carboxymuconolactone decarboxylase family protein, partial [Lentimicrobiaceae bacterium]|nr:carboxymuconolactone decarboxylase family protein [Lentimicrobiaceae bacterium]